MASPSLTVPMPMFVIPSARKAAIEIPPPLSVQKGGSISAFTFTALAKNVKSKIEVIVPIDKNDFLINLFFNIFFKVKLTNNFYVYL